MLRGLYSVAGAMEMASRNHEIISENIVNATTPGYRRQGMLFETAASSITPSADGNAAPARPSSRTPSSYSYFEMGSLQQTNNPLDLAVSGNAFFVLDGPNGPIYTRNGAFSLSPTGELLTRGGGYRVRGQGSALTLPTNGATIVVGTDGTIQANGATVGQLQLASFSNPESMRRVGTTLFEADAPPETPPPNSVRVQQGYREGSNVQPAQEMVSMMQGMRFYEAAQKAMQVISEAIGQNTRPPSS